MPVTRRQFCGALGASLAVANANLLADDSKPKPLRVIAYNIYKCTGWPNDRPLAQQAVAKGQMAKRLAIELALHDSDIINFSESPNEELTKEVAELLGMNHVRFPSGGNWPGTLLSKFEIIESQNAPMKGERPKELFTRHWGRATVKLLNGDPLIVHSAHLYPTADPSVRLREIRAMIESMKTDLDAGRSMLLIGDLNHVPDTDEYKLWIDAGWVDTFAKVGEGDGPTIKADTPERRIDYVMAAGPIAERVTESRPLFEGAFRLNLHFRRSSITSELILPRKRPSEKLEVLTPNQYSKGQGWLSVNAPADLHKLNIRAKASRPSLTSVSDLPDAIPSDDVPSGPACL